MNTNFTYKRKTDKTFMTQWSHWAPMDLYVVLIHVGPRSSFPVGFTMDLNLVIFFFLFVFFFFRSNLFNLILVYVGFMCCLNFASSKFPNRELEITIICFICCSEMIILIVNIYWMLNSARHCYKYFVWKVKVKVAQSCLTLCDPMDYRVHGILQARILKWVAFPFSRGSFQPRDQTQGSHIAGRFFTSWATREAQVLCIL